MLCGMSRNAEQASILNQGKNKRYKWHWAAKHCSAGKCLNETSLQFQRLVEFLLIEGIFAACGSPTFYWDTMCWILGLYFLWVTHSVYWSNISPSIFIDPVLFLSPCFSVSFWSVSSFISVSSNPFLYTLSFISPYIFPSVSPSSRASRLTCYYTNILFAEYGKE